MKKLFLVLSFLFLLFVVPSTGYTLTAILSGFDVQVQFSEPTTNSDGSQLTDLHHTTIWYDAGAGQIKGIEILATSINGGGINILGVINVPIVIGQEKNVTFWATSFDITGNESASSNSIIIKLDRLAPAPPQ